MTPAQQALLPRIRKGDIEALAEYLALGLGTGVTIGPPMEDEPSDE